MRVYRFFGEDFLLNDLLIKLEIKPFVLEAKALLKELELRPYNRVFFVCESRWSELIETSVKSLNGGKQQNSPLQLGQQGPGLQWWLSHQSV